MLGGNEFGRVVTELEDMRRVVTLGSEDARSDARAVRELYDRSLQRERRDEVSDKLKRE